MAGVAQPTSGPSRILRRIHGWGRGRVFVPKDFLDLGARAAVDAALTRLHRRGAIRRLGRGVYDYPAVHARLGPLTPDPDLVAQAVVRSTDCLVVCTGARAANVLGLSTQVPAQATYLTDGTSRVLRVGGWTLRFQHAAPASLVGGDTVAGLVVRAIRYLGREHVGDDVVQRLRAAVAEPDKRALARLAHGAPAWMRPVIDRLASAEPAP